MMETGNLNIMQYLTAGREGGEVEFKQTTGQLERGMETLCAFLNSAGGTVLFGVMDNGKIIGQEVSDKTKRDIAEAIRLIEPFATITVSYECRRVGISDPEFHTDGSSVWVVFRYKRETAGQAPDKYPTSTRQVSDKHRRAH